MSYAKERTPLWYYILAEASFFGVYRWDLGDGEVAPGDFRALRGL